MGIPITLGSLKTSLDNLKQEDYIPCKYTSYASGIPGIFYDLGIDSGIEIPLEGSATPDGKFYFIKADKGLLIADRILQHSISWDALNSFGYIEGVSIGSKDLFPIPMTSSYQNGVKVEVSAQATGSDGFKTFDKLINTAWTAPAIGSAWLRVTFDNPIQCTHMNILSFTGQYMTVKFYDINNTLIYTDTISIWNGATQNTTYRFNYLNYKLKTTTKIKKVEFSANSSNGGYNSFTLHDISFMNTPVIIRSLTGGIAYSDINGNKSFIAYDKNCYPIDNDWDRYINSNLNGKAINSNDIWNKSILTYCRETPLYGSYISSTNEVVNVSNTSRVCRGTNSSWYDFGTVNSTSIQSTIGFRPCIEYIESDGSSRQTNLWY